MNQTNQEKPIESEKMTDMEMIPFTSEIKVRDFDESLRFYTETLGFEALRIDRIHRFATLVFNGGQFLIQEDKSVQAPRGLGVFFRFFVPGDIKEFHDLLVERGVKISKPLKTMDYGLIRFYAEDLDGFQVKFVKKNS